MPDDQQELRRVNWGEVLPFTQLFRAFRLAIHPSKLVLALAALLLTYAVGRVMDCIWPRTVSRPVSLQAAAVAPEGVVGPVLSEVRAYIDLKGGKNFCQWLTEAQKADKQAKTAPGASKAHPGKGVFATLLDHEIATFRNGLHSLLALNLGLGTRPPTGLKAALIDALGGVVWLFAAHWLYAVIFTALSLLIWSLFGGAVCRIAALHAARDEKIALKQALSFSARKLFSFFSAPLIPVALVFAIGLIVFLGGLFCAIPVLGEIVAGLLWPLALFGGFIIVLVMIGAVTGFMLMFPTIAVEGSDSFDALSRSFSYVYSKPWRTTFYVLVSGIYGSICYLFVRLFAHLLFNVTHIAAGLGMNINGSGKDKAIGKLDAIWSKTSLLDAGAFYGSFGQHPLDGPETFAKYLIVIWTFIVVGLVVAFVISFFFSASTIIYYLLRREVDATDIEDVYLEEFEEEAIPPAGEAKAPETAAPPSPAQPSAPAGPAPAPPQAEEPKAEPPGAPPAAPAPPAEG